MLDRSEAVALLRRRLDNLDEDVAEQLASELGDLPLALEQVAAYLERTQVPPATYLLRFRARRANMLSLGEDLAYQGTVDTAWSLTLAHLERTNPAAAVLLQLCALLAPEPIPLDVFTAQPDLLPESLRRAVADDPDASIDEQVATALSYSMCRRNGGTIQVHRLVQAVIESKLPDWRRADLIDAAQRLLAHAVPPDADDPSNWPRWAVLGPHLLAVSAGLEADSDPHGLRSAVDKFCWHLYASGDYHAAHQIETALLARYRRVLGPDDPVTLSMANNLSVIVRALGDTRAARELDEDTLTRCRSVLGYDHPATLRAANDLAADLSVDEPEASRELHEDNLVRCRRVLGESHERTLHSANNLAFTLRSLGEYQAAHEMDRRTLAGYRRLYPENHPAVLTSLGNVAEDLRGLGEHSEARKLHEEVLARQRIYLGPDHPYTLGSAFYLAAVLWELGEIQSSRELNEDTLERRRRILGDDHPYTVHSARRLVRDLRELGEEDAARSLGDEFSLVAHQSDQ